MSGVILEDDDRVGHRIDVSLTGDSPRSGYLSRKISDFQKRDEKSLVQYRRYRDRDIPIFELPEGVGTIDKVRGEDAWQVHAFVTPPLLSDVIVLLASIRPVYASLHEKLSNRRRTLMSFDIESQRPE